MTAPIRTAKEDGIFLKARNLFESAVRSSTYTIWARQAEDDQKFYENDQWTAEEKQVLESRGQPALVLNKVSPKIDAMCGVELKTQTKISYKATRIGDKEQTDLADAFTYLAFHTQEKENVPSKQSQAFKDGFITGLGWLEVDVLEKGNIAVDLPDPFEMVWDIDDPTHDMSKQMYGGRQKWTALEDAMILFPDYADELKTMVKTDAQRNPGLLPSSTYQAPADSNDYSALGNDAYVDGQRGRLRIVVMHYREGEDVFYARADTGKLYRFYDEDQAKKFGKVEKKKELTNKFAVVCGNLLLDYGIHQIQGPYLPLIPFVYKRTRATRVPFGLIRSARDAQTEYNKRRSKALHLLNTRQVIADVDAVEDFDVLLREVSRPDGLILKRSGKDLDIKDNIQLGEAQMELMNISSSEIQETMGVFDEVTGQKTNAVSGRAIDNRVSGSVRTQSFAFDNLKNFKKRFGEVLLPALQQAFDYDMKLDILNDEELVKSVQLNVETTDEKGKKIVVNDVRTLNFKVNVTEVPDYSARPEEIREYVTNMVMNGQGQWLMSPEFNRLMGVSQPEELAKSMQGAMKSFAASQPGAGAANPGGAGQPPGVPPSPQQ